MTPTRPWLDARKDTEQRVDLLLAEMTLDEKIGQMHQVHGRKEDARDLLRAGRLGSVFNASGADAGNVRDEGVNARQCNELQRIAAGKSTTVRFTLRAADLAFTGVDCRPCVEPGRFHLWVGQHADDGLEAQFTVERGATAM
ncbi:MAG: hypothetical protein GF331_18060 [Chitinivibrionales bacterium]|nr:hypothetical protein [Chitinivibrionales bacterium]